MLALVVPLIGQAPAGIRELEIGYTGTQAWAADQFGRQYPATVTDLGERPVAGHVNSFVRTTAVWVETRPLSPSERPLIRLDSAGSCQQGASYGLLACLNQYYTRSGSAVAVDRYVAVWSRDDRQVALGRAVVRAGVLGRCLPSSCSGTLSDSQELVVESPMSESAYVLRPRWAGKFVEVEGVSYQCGNSVLTWRRGTATYDLEHGNVCQGDGSIPGSDR